MYNIEIRHSCIIIHGYKWNDNWNIQKMFSIYDKAYHRYYTKCIYYDEKNHDLYLPGGLDMGYVVENFGNNITKKMEADPYDQLMQIKLKSLPRDDDQKKAIKFCVGKEPFMNNVRAPQIALNLNTGVGKTYVMIATSAYFSIRTMIIVNTQGLLEQWRERIKDYTDTEDSQIYDIMGSGSIGRILKAMIPIKRIRYFLCMHSTLRHYGTKYGWEKVRELFQTLKCGIKVFDEAHLYFDNISMIDYFSDTCRTYYLTATPQRSDFNENKIYQRAFANVPCINLYKEELNHTDYIAIKFNSHPSPAVISSCKNAYGFDRITYMNYLVTTKNYYKLLRMLMEDVLQLDGKVLIYIGTNYGIMMTYNWLNYNYHGVSIGIYSSLTPKELKEQQLESKIILSTTKSCGAAMDISNLKATIVLDEPFKSVVMARQTLGRTRGQDTLYYDIVDMGFGALAYYYKAKRSTFKKYAKSIQEISVTDKMMNDFSIAIHQRDMALIAQAQQRQNLKQVIEFVKKD